MGWSRWCVAAPVSRGRPAVRRTGWRAGTFQGAGHGGWPQCIGCVRAAASTRISASPSGWHGGVGLVAECAQDVVGPAGELAGDRQRGPVGVDPRGDVGVVAVVRGTGARSLVDRKSTRLNSSHLVISYAVFCLKKKK